MVTVTIKLTTGQLCSVIAFRSPNFRYLFILSLICFTSLLVKGQSSYGVSLNKTYPSPDVAALGSFGLMPANPFNGQANVSIPLYTVSYKDLEVPITLSYATGGLKPDDHPGWTGLGWSLQSGGMIFRKVNGRYDEFPTNTLLGSHLSYYEHCGRVTASFNNLDTIKAYAFDGSNLPLAYGFDAMADEFIFNFNGYSGVFYITRPSINGPVEIKVRPNGAYRLKAEIVEIKPSITFDDFYNTQGEYFQTRLTNRSIYKLKITDDKGIQYVFGGDPHAIEFSNNGNFSSDTYTIASAWHLTEIVSPAGYKIQFTYKKKGRVISQHQQRNVTFFNIDYNFGHNTLILFRNTNGEYSYSGGMDITTLMIQNPAWLEKIITPLQTITFASSRSNELAYSLSQDKVTEVMSPSDKFGAGLSYWQKLDEINIPGVKTIHFNYRHQSDKRLRLDSLVFVAPNQHKILGYGFRYNDLLLPSYNSRQSDHWGYFNNRSYAYGNDYLNVREPVAEYLQAEMLKQINYPTGGYLKLEYEPHHYRKLCKQFPFSVESQSADLMAGGLRVKKMISTANANDTPLVKEYFYISNYINQGTASSGILSGAPQYTNTGSSRNSYRTGNFWAGTWGSHRLYYGKIVDNNFLQLSSTNGNHVTYSEVTEKSGDGYIVYKYSNHDNGYIDKAPYLMHSNFTSQVHEEAFISLAPFRGLPVNTTYFNEAKQRLKSISYNYFIDTTNAYKVPSFYRINENIAGAGLTRVSTTAFFTKPALLRSQIETDYIAGTTDSLFVNKNYRYYPDIYAAGAPSNDNYQPADVSRNTSKNETVKTVFRYPFDMVQLSADPTGVYQEMTGMNIVSPVIETITSKGTTQLELIRNNYFKPATGIYALDSVEVKSFNEPVETRFRVHKYDGKGNIIEQSKPNDVNEVILWGYKGQYPVAKIRGSSYTTAVQYVNLSILENAQIYTDARLRTELNRLRTNLPNAFVTTYTWFPLKGMATETDAQGRTAFYEYDAAGRLKLVKNQDGHIVKKFCYNYAGQPSACEGFVYNSVAREEPFTRNNCTGCQVPSTVMYTVPAKKYYSELNQEDADAQATAEINANGQNYANQNGTCSKPYIFVRMVLENINSGPMITTADVVFKFYNDSTFSNRVSVTGLDVNYRATWNHCGTNPQIEESDHIINCTGLEKRFHTELYRDIGDGIHCFSTSYELLGSDCYYHTVFANEQRSQSFNRNNCTAGFTGTAVTYTVPYGRYRSIVSQAVVEAQALADMNANGQNHANANGSCVVYNVQRSQDFTRNNCTAPQYGGTVTYTVPAGKHSSTISQEDANAKAQNDINTNGQNYANANGACINPGFPFVKMVLTNYSYNGMSTSADMVFTFYSNPQKTVPMSVTNLDVRYLATTMMCDGQTSSGPITVRCNGTSVTRRVDINYDIGDGLHCYAMEYELLAGSNYYK